MNMEIVAARTLMWVQLATVRGVHNNTPRAQGPAVGDPPRADAVAPVRHLKVVDQLLPGQ